MTAPDLHTSDESTNYALDHFPSHLAASGQREQLIQLLTSFPYIAARVAAGQLFVLARPSSTVVEDESALASSRTRFFAHFCDVCSATK